jgi:hypothetical protein
MMPFVKSSRLFADYFHPRFFLGVHLSTMNPTLARYYNKFQTQSSNRKIPEKEGVMIEKVNKCCLNQ